MDYAMDDSQNSAPDALEASKLNSPAQRNETQSVTKRFVLQPYTYNHSPREPEYFDQFKTTSC